MEIEWWSGNEAAAVTVIYGSYSRCTRWNWSGADDRKGESRTERLLHVFFHCVARGWAIRPAKRRVWSAGNRYVLDKRCSIVERLRLSDWLFPFILRWLASREMIEAHLWLRRTIHNLLLRIKSERRLPETADRSNLYSLIMRICTDLNYILKQVPSNALF